MSLLTEPSNKPDAAAQARARMHGALDWLKHAGHSFDGFERILDYWRWLGAKRAIAIVVLVITPLVKFVWLPTVASHAVEALAESHGLDLEVGSWSAELLDLRATGHDVVLKASGRYGRPELMKADGLTVDLSVWALFGRYGLIKEISFDEPTVYLERTLAGRWNWEDIADARALRSTMTISNVRLDGLRIEWVENLPSDSGGGLIRSSKATLHIDDVNLLVQDVTVPLDIREAASRFTLDGRTADGRLSVQGNANFFRWDRGLRPGRGAQKVSYPASVSASASASASDTAGDVWAPSVKAKFYLENVGTPALGQMFSSNALVMASGRLTGNIELVLDAHRINCITDLVLKDVAYEVNPASAVARENSAAVAQGLTGLRITRRVQAGCDGDQSGLEWRPLNSLQTSITREALKDAPPVVQRVANIDQQRVAGTITKSELEQLTSTISEGLALDAGQKLAGALGGQVGGAMSRSLTGSAAQRGTAAQSGQTANPVSRGIKGVGRGIKGLFTKKKSSGQ